MQQIVVVEVAAQVIEFLYYILTVTACLPPNILFRYVDWCLSTPLMLVGLMGFLRFVGDGTSVLELMTPSAVSWTIATLFSNALMLVCGVLAERCSKRWEQLWIIFGFLMLTSTFQIIFHAHVRDSGSVTACVVVTIVYLLWSLYGIAALQDDNVKQVAYNCLDVVSKNMFGIFLLAYTMADART